MKNSRKCVKIGKYKNFCRVRKEAFVTMTEQGKVHYLLVRGYEEFHDEDEWLGIYSTWENAIAAYEREHAALEREGFSSAHPEQTDNCCRARVHFVSLAAGRKRALYTGCQHDARNTQRERSGIFF